MDFTSLSIPKNVLVESGISAIFVAKFCLFFALILIFTVFIGKICRHFFKIPVIAGQILAGILLGPTFLNLANWNVFNDILKMTDSPGQVYSLAYSDIFIFIILLISGSFTVSYLLWMAGYETDIQDMKKIGPTAILAGSLGAIVPIFMCAALMYFFSVSLGASVGIGLIFSATSVSIPVAMLVSQNKMSLRFSKATMAAAIVDDILAVVLLSIFVVTLRSGLWGVCVVLDSIHCTSVTQSLIQILIAFIGFFVFGLTIVKYLANWLSRLNLTSVLIPFAFSVILLYFSFAELVGGLAGITGAYFAGVFLRKYDKEHKIEHTISPFVSAIFVPIFLASIGFQVNLLDLSFKNWIVAIALFVVAILSKLFGVYITTFISNFFFEKSKKWSFVESFLFGSSMVARGEVGLVIATLLKSTGLIEQDIYVVCIVVIILTTLAAPLMLAVGFRFYKEIKTGQDKVRIQLGTFDIFGTQNMFEAIVNILQQQKMHNTEIYLYDGKVLINIESSKVELIYYPKEGIVIEGSKDAAEKMLQIVNSELKKDFLRLEGYKSSLQ